MRTRAAVAAAAATGKQTIKKQTRALAQRAIMSEQQEARFKLAKAALHSGPAPFNWLLVRCCYCLCFGLLIIQQRATVEAQLMQQQQPPQANELELASNGPSQIAGQPQPAQQQPQSAAASVLAALVSSARQMHANRPQPPLAHSINGAETGDNSGAPFQWTAPNPLQAAIGANGTVAGQQQLSADGDYRQQGEILRQEIMRRASQLQQVVASSHEMIKNNGDLIVSRLLDQLNHRLNIAKSKADKIINEPTTNEVALRALGTINQGLNNVNNIITNIMNQNRSKLNLQQISRQFSTALNAVQKQLNSQQQQQQQQQLQQMQQQQ